MNVARFLDLRPEFRNVDPRIVQAALDEASRWVSPSVWGNKLDDGMSLWAADVIVTSPMGGATRLDPGTTSWYRQRIDDLLPTVACGRFLVAGC